MSRVIIEDVRNRYIDKEIKNNVCCDIYMYR